MKAIVITDFGDPSVLEVQEVKEPKPAAGQILVRVRATALNRADLLQRRGLYPPPPGTRPDVPGLEFAGEVEALGPGVTQWKSGDRVMGLLPGEGYAEKVVTAVPMAMPVPADMTLEQAAAIPEVFMTAYDALFVQVGLQEGERLLIHAVGSGVGSAALQLAKGQGATCLGTAGDKSKLLKAVDLGLDTAINYRQDDFFEMVMARTGRQGVNVILDLVGSAYWEKNLACLAPLGRLILVGLVSGSKTQTDLGTLLRKRLRVFGTVLRPRPIEEKIKLTKDFRARVLPRFASGELKPIVDRVFPLEEAAQGHRYMEANRNFGKIVLTVS